MDDGRTRTISGRGELTTWHQSWIAAVMNDSSLACRRSWMACSGFTSVKGQADNDVWVSSLQELRTIQLTLSFCTNTVLMASR